MIQDETRRVQERLLETTKKLVDVETHYEESERVRKVVDAKSLACDDKFEMQEYQLVEGKFCASYSYLKFIMLNFQLEDMQTRHIQNAKKPNENFIWLSANSKKFKTQLICTKVNVKI